MISVRSAAFARRRALGAIAALTLVTTAACSGSSDQSGDDAPGAASSIEVEVNEDARALLPEEIRSAGKLTVSSSLDYPPFEFVEDGENMGFDIDLINALVATLGLEIEIVRVPFEGEIAGLAANRFDIAMATFTVTPEREQEVDFVKFLETGSIISVLGGSENEDEISSTDDLCGRSVGVISGSSSAALIPELQETCDEQGGEPIDVQNFNNQSSTVMAVMNGRVDAKIDDSTTSQYVADAAGGQLVDVGDVFATAEAGLAVGKDDPDLRAAMEAALQVLRDNGVYDQLLEEWGQTKNAYEPESEPTQ